MEMNLPRNYVEIEEEEMMYLEGGTYLSKTTSRNVIAAVGMNPYSLIAAALAVTAVTRLVNYIGKTFGGFWGWCAGAVAGWAGSQVLAFGKGIAGGALNKGVDVTWSWNVFDFGVNCSIYR